MEPFQMAYFKPLRLYKHLKQSCKKPYCFLGIDTGESFTGFSLTSTDLREAWPHKTCFTKGKKQLRSNVLSMIVDKDVGGCLIGYSPMDDPTKQSAHKAMLLKWMKPVFGPGEELANFPFTFVNEKDSSDDAKELLEGRFFESKLDYELALNRYAAFIFTQNWLDLMHSEHCLEELGKEWNETNHRQ